MDKEIDNNGFDYVDLGLPYGTLWATCNVGADNPSESGLYFQWGDIEGYDKDEVGFEEEAKKGFTWKDYKFNPSGDGETFTKYTTNGEALNLEDDAAHIHMGGNWHIPTPAQFKELRDYTESKLTIQDNVMGMKFASKNGKSIFIPAAGEAWDWMVAYDGLYGYLWTSMVSSLSNYYGQYLYFDLWGAKQYYGEARWVGMPVRGVIG